MKKITLILILIIMSTFAMPIALAVIDIPSITAQAGPPDSGTINGTFIVYNLETYNDARFNVSMVGILVVTHGGAEMVPGSATFDPSGSIIIANGSFQRYNYSISMTGLGSIQIRSEVYGNYDENTSLGSGSDGAFNVVSPLSRPPVAVTPKVPEFYTLIIPILLSIILFVIVRHRLE